MNALKMFACLGIACTCAFCSGDVDGVVERAVAIDRSVGSILLDDGCIGLLNDGYIRKCDGMPDNDKNVETIVKDGSALLGDVVIESDNNSENNEGDLDKAEYLDSVYKRNCDAARDFIFKYCGDHKDSDWGSKLDSVKEQMAKYADNGMKTVLEQERSSVEEDIKNEWCRRFWMSAMYEAYNSADACSVRDSWVWGEVYARSVFGVYFGKSKAELETKCIDIMKDIVKGCIGDVLCDDACDRMQKQKTIWNMYEMMIYVARVIKTQEIAGCAEKLGALIGDVIKQNEFSIQAKTIVGLEKIDVAKVYKGKRHMLVEEELVWLNSRDLAFLNGEISGIVGIIQEYDQEFVGGRHEK